MAATHSDVERFRRNLRGEVDSASLYRALSSAESSPQLAEVYSRLAEVEERHAELWRTKIEAAGEQPPTLKPGLRVRILSWLAQRLGPDAVLPLVLSGEASDTGMYEDQPEARDAGLPADERSHARVFRAIAATS